ncbi:MAG TPA: SRPBCC family protein [Flavitalea sp.]|nr:SRPBCC family protein [Flavitalea sp.]
MSDQLTATKQIGKEYLSANEDRIAAGMINELKAQVDRMYAGKFMRRQIHPKMHGCVKAAFVIEQGLPDHLRVGVFSLPRTYHAWVRFSNASTDPKPDKKKDVRGIAIKLMGVPGEKLLNRARHQQTQDFLLMNSETFFSRNVEEFSKLLTAATATSKSKLLLFALNPFHWPLLKRVSSSNKRCSNPLSIAYWSTQPYQFGSGNVAVKYHLRPSPDNVIVNENLDDDLYLRNNLVHTLYDHQAAFDFYVQFQTDPDTMPIEDPTVPWESPYIKLASLIIPSQTFDEPQQLAFGENLSFNVWHSLPEHRPLGSFNRVRKRVYEALSAYRHEKNEEPHVEPTDSDDFLPTLHPETNGMLEFAIPLKGVVVSRASILVNCSKETAFRFISSSEKLSSWMKKSGPVSAVRMVDIIQGPYDHVGATRKVSFDNGDTIQEELISWHPYANYAYRVSKFSDFLKNLTKEAFGQVWFDTMEDQTRINWVYSYQYKNLGSRLVLFLFNRFVFKKFMAASLAHAKARIESLR